MAESLPARLERLIKGAGVAVSGVSVGTDSDRATWRVEPESLQAAAQPVIDAFQPMTAAQEADEQAQMDVDARALKAVAMALWECIPAPLLTRAQMRARAVAFYKTLG